MDAEPPAHPRPASPRRMDRIVAFPAGVGLILVALWGLLFVGLGFYFAGNPPDPTVLSGDPCCDYPSNWRDVAAGTAWTIVTGLIDAMVATAGFAAIRWSITTRMLRRRTFKLVAAYTPLLIMAAIIAAQVIPGRIT